MEHFGAKQKRSARQYNSNAHFFFGLLMSTLQVSLLVIVVIVAAGVYAYNLFEERQMRRKMDAAFSKHEDVLLEPPTAREEERREPVLAHEELEPTQRIALPEDEAAPEARPQLEATQPIAPPESAGYGVREETEAPDPQTECVVLLKNLRLAADHPARLSALDFGKPVRWLAQLEDKWFVAGPSMHPAQGAACLLLVNRNGPATREQIEQFYAALREGNATLWTAENFPAVAQELARAEEMDRRCADLDIQVGLNLLRNNGAPLAGTRLRGVAEAAGFHLTEHGQFDYVNEETGKLLFTLTNIEHRPLTAENLKSMHTQGITLLLDVPRVADPVRAFDHMRVLAKRLAVTLEASLLDDNRQPLSDTALATIRTHIQHAAAALNGMQVEPGGVRALRLFA